MKAVFNLKKLDRFHDSNGKIEIIGKMVGVSWDLFGPLFENPWTGAL